MRLFAALILCTAATTATATTGATEESFCLFTQECPLGDTCLEINFAMRVVVQTDRMSSDPLAPPPFLSAQIETDAETLVGLPISSADGKTKGVFVATPNGDRHLLSFTQKGAFYSVHLPKERLALQYSGTCEAVK
jgi:hypothetical protein